MRYLLAAGVLVMGWTAYAEPVRAGSFEDGNLLLRQCQASLGGFDRGVCMGFITGVADVLGNNNPVHGWRACFPTGVTIGQMTDVTIQYLKASPQKRHMTAHSLVAEALERAFPCQ
jgi:hypothetical protein